MRARAGAAAIVFALGVPTAARAAETVPPSELALTWQAPAGCPATADVEAQFMRLLGGAARTPSGKRIAATGVVRVSSGERWTLDLATILDGSGGHRSLKGDSCASLASAAALILALMIDPDAVGRAAEVEPVTPSPPPKATPPTVVAVAAPPPEPPALRFVARAFAGAVTLFPSPTPAAGLAVGVRRGRLGAELTFVASLEHRATAGDGTTGADARFLAGGARACGALGGRAVVFNLCLGGELERVSGAGFGPITSKSDGATMLAGTGGLLVMVPFTSAVGLALDLGAAVRPYHPSFTIDELGRLFGLPLVSAFGALGLYVSL